MTWDNRDFTYNERGQLTAETFTTWAPGTGSQNRTWNYIFDYGSEGGPGVRTVAVGGFSELGNRGAYAMDSWGRPAQEEVDSPTLSSTSTQESFDNAGNFSTRSQYLATGERYQQASWDAWGRLSGYLRYHEIGFVESWTAQYDGLGRRIQTAWTTDQFAEGETPRITRSYYDPQVEFLELGLSVGGNESLLPSGTADRVWKLFGSDISGTYGGAQGIGGLEVALSEVSGSSASFISDRFGHVVARTSNGSSVQWSDLTTSQGYGIVPGSLSDAPSENLRLTDAASFASTVAWRTHAPDPTGLYYLGARYYDPEVGRFISPDPLGFGSDPSLYAYANGDPVNFCDPDGRLTAGFSNWALSKSHQAMDTWNGILNPGTRLQTLTEHSAGGLRGTLTFASEQEAFSSPTNFLMNKAGISQNQLALQALNMATSHYGVNMNSSAANIGNFQAQLTLNAASLFIPMGPATKAGTVVSHFDDGVVLAEKFSKTFGSFDDYWRASNPQAKIESLMQQYGLSKHLAGKTVTYAGEKLAVSGGVHPLSPSIIKIYDEGLSLGDRHFVETLIEEAHHSKLLKLFPESGLPKNNSWWNSVVEGRAKDYAKEYADRIFGR